MSKMKTVRIIAGARNHVRRRSQSCPKTCFMMSTTVFNVVDRPYSQHATTGTRKVRADSLNVALTRDQAPSMSFGPIWQISERPYATAPTLVRVAGTPRTIHPHSRTGPRTIASYCKVSLNALLNSPTNSAKRKISLTRAARFGSSGIECYYFTRERIHLRI